MSWWGLCWGPPAPTFWDHCMGAAIAHNRPKTHSFDHFGTKVKLHQSVRQRNNRLGMLWPVFLGCTWSNLHRLP